MKRYLQTWIQLIFLFITISGTEAQVRLERTKVTKEISMKVPVGFIPMSEADLIRKYVSARKPIAMYTDAGRQTDLGINETSNTWSSNDLEILKDFYKANILNLFTKVRFVQEDLRTIGDRQFVIFEFVSTISDEESAFGNASSTSKYTYIQYTIKDDKILLFNFTCPARDQTIWQETAKEIMESVRIR